MNIKVKKVNLVEEKSAQEIEADLLKKHEDVLHNIYCLDMLGCCYLVQTYYIIIKKY